jgi:fructokinase
LKQPTILCAGEMLWDVLPRGEFIGGAPFNVAGHAARLGARALLATRVGDDERGRRALAAAAELGIDTTWVQVDARFPTGEARALLDAAGAAHYEFLTPAAWDNIALTPGLLDAASACDAFVHGTLGQRDARSRSSITALAAKARWRVYDPNLRAPYFDHELCVAGLQGAALVKLNDEECRMLAGWLDCAADHEALAPRLLADFGVGALCVTLGAAGASLWWRGHWYHQHAVRTEVADTVGAGDAFLAMLTCELLRGSDATDALARACCLASFVASQSGAVPAYDGTRFRA